MRRRIMLAALVMIAGGGQGHAQTATPETIARGKYLAEFGGCNDCHTPG